MAERIWEFRIAILWGFAFVADAMITGFLLAVYNADVNSMTKFGWFLLLLGVVKQGITALMAFLKQANASIRQGTPLIPPPIGGATEFFGKQMTPYTPPTTEEKKP